MKLNKIKLLLPLFGILLCSCSFGNNESGKINDETFTVTWKNYDGSILEIDNNVAYGVNPSYDGAIPTKNGDCQFTYTFDGWSPELSLVTSNQVYIAQYSTETHKYVVTWENYDGTILEVDANVPYGTIPSYDGAIPTKPDDDHYTYTFIDWSPELTEVTSDQIYFASYIQNIKSIEYNITYVLNGGTNDSDNPSSYYFGTDTIYLSSPTKENDLFDGWYLEPTFETEISQIFNNTEGDLTLYAKWCGLEPFTYSVFNAGGLPIIHITGINEGFELVSIDLSSIRNFSVEAIYSCAFSDCTSLISVKLPNSLRSIGDDTFKNCFSLEKVYITDLEAWCRMEFANKYSNPLSYAHNLYLNNELVTNLVIPDSVSEIKQYVFYNCTSLTSINIHDSVTRIETDAFLGCTQAAYTEYYNCLYLGNELNPYLYLANVKNNLITSCNIHSNCKLIGSHAFENCSSLTSITIPNSVTSIGAYAFENCFSLEGVYISDLEAWCNISFNVGYYGTGTTNPLYYAHNLYLNTVLVTDLVIPNTITSIGNYAFYNCSSITSITIPNTITYVGYGAFCGCSSLTSITIPNSVTHIGDGAFENCFSLERVYISDLEAWCNNYFSTVYSNPLYYAHNLFLNDKLVTDLVIPNTITSIGNLAFYNCSSITSITIPNTITYIGSGAFCGCSSLTSITIPNSVTHIANGAFSGCSSITSITIPNSVTSIETGAFEGCSSLTSIVIPNSVTSIESGAFQGCSSITSITIPNSVTSIGGRAFYDCSSLTSVTIGNGVTSIETGAFEGCSSLTSIVIPNSVTSLGESVFHHCSSLTSVTIGNGVTSIGYNTFSGCSSLTSIVIPNSVTYIGVGAFDGCSSLTSITIPNSVTSIGELAFYECTSLTSITIPNSVTSIGERAFSYCSSLTSITIPNSVTSIESGAFSICSSLTSITIPNSVTSMGNYVFDGCSSLTIYCEAESQPDGWNSAWNNSDCRVVWGYTPEM